MFYYYLKIDQETDVASCDNVSGLAMELWKDPVSKGEGPSLENAVFDWIGGKKSEWNIIMVSKLARKIMDEANKNWCYLPKYEFFYWQESVWRKFRNLSFRWNRAPCKRKRDGNFENIDEASARLLLQQKKERRSARKNTRRHSVRNSDN